jgi:probable HAF family extracellular repeat protein
MTRFRTSRIVPVAVLAVAAALPAAAAAPAAAATTYTITDLGSLGLGSDGSAVNATGQVTGYSYLSTLVPTPECPPVYGNTKKTCVEHPWHAFFYSSGQMTDLGTVGGGDFSYGNAINRSGWVAGESSTNNGGGAAFVWNGKKMTDLGQQAPLNGSDSTATGINDSGQVAGSWGDLPAHAFLYSNGTITRLPEPGFVATSNLGCQVAGMNNNAQVVGNCWGYDLSLSSLYSHAVLWQNGTVTDLGTLGGLKSTAAAINNNGQIVGSAETSTGATDGFLYSNGTMTDLGSFTPAAINNNGVMVGGPYIDSGGTVQNLNNLIPAGSPYQIQNATAINDNGQIVANDGDALLLTPA